MSDQFNNNSEKSIFKTESKEYIEENSTIFTKKSYGDKPKKNVATEGSKRVVLTVVSLCLAVAVIFGVFSIIKFIPDTVVSSSDSSFGVPMVTFDTNNLSSVSISYDNTSCTFYKHLDESSTSSGSAKYYWTIDEINKKWVSSSNAESYVKMFASISALKSIELDSDIDYGFDNPKFIANVKTEDGKYDYTLTVGNQIAALGEYYVCLNDRYYVMPESSVESFYVYPTDFANTTLFEAVDSEDLPDYFNQDVLSYFDYINVSGSNFSEDIRILCNKDDPSYNYYTMVSPYDRYADPEFLDGFFAMFTDGLHSSGIYSYTSTDEELANYGLDNPIAELVVKIGNYQIKLKVGPEQDGYYPTLFGDNSPIYKMSTSNDSMFFVTALVEEYVSVITIGDFITEISSFKFMFDGFDKTIKLTHNEENTSDWTASVDGQEINATAVQNLYQHVILAAPIITLFEAEKNDVILKVIISYTDGSPDKLLEFTEHTDGTRRYVSWVDGEAQGIVTKDRVFNIIENAQKVVNGEVIASPI